VSLGQNALRFCHPGWLTGRRLTPGALSIGPPAPALRLGNPRAASLGFRARRQSTMEAAARLSAFYPYQASAAWLGSSRRTAAGACAWAAKRIGL